REEPLAAHRTTHLQPDLVAILVLIPRRLCPLPVEGLGQQDPRDAQGLLGDRGQLRQRLLGLPRDPSPDLADAALDDHEDGHDDDRDQREPPVDQDHRDQRGDDGDGVPEDARHGVRQHPGDAADVVLQTRLDHPGLRTGEEAQLHRLQVLEQTDAEISGDAVAH
ncbi:hypothetical protein ABE10_02970, partial [Bacillus toyonensis]|nr:hypothetical protein [Bacillus toyonensis]